MSADTIIELTFTPGSYCMQLSADVYQDWKFTDQAFPADVISRWAAMCVCSWAAASPLSSTCLLGSSSSIRSSLWEGI